jgi:putative intracellular protease/amidase
LNPAYTIADCPRVDVLLMPGGYGTWREMHNEALMGWIAEKAKDVDLLLSLHRRCF